MAIKPAGFPFHVYGLTGMIGSGKSAAADFFRELGAYIIDADVLAREAVAPGTQVLADIVAHFGAEILSSDGSLDRRRLGRIVFADARKLKALEAIIHPEVRRLFAAKLEALRQAPPAGLRAVLYVVPLLFETNDPPRRELERSILVAAPKEECVRRAAARSPGLSREEAERRYAAQMPETEKRKRADFVIENDGSLEDLRARVKEMYGRM